MEGLIQTGLDVALFVGLLVALAGLFLGERAAVRELSLAASGVLLLLLIGAGGNEPAPAPAAEEAE
jgi:hypothetical protein